MSDIDSVVSLLPTASETYVNNLSSSISAGAATVPVNAANDYLDGDVVVLTVDPGTTEEATFTGTKASTPDRFTNCVWTEGNLGVGHASGATIIDYDSATHFNMLSKAMKGILNQDGSYKKATLEAILNVAQRTADLFGDFLIQAPITDTTGLSQTYGEVIGYIGGERIRVATGTVLVLTASSDNYVYLENTNQIKIIDLGLGSPAPSLPANSLWLGKYVTDGSSITSSDETLRDTSPVATNTIKDGAVTSPKIGTTVTDGTNTGGGGGNTRYTRIGGLLICWGETAQSPSIGSGSEVTRVINFPVAFSAPPIFVGTANNNTNEVDLLVRTTSVSTGSATALVVNTTSGGSSGTARIHWIAIGAA